MTKILIADDDPHILMLSQLILNDEGYDLIQANNGQEAINIAIKEEPDIIFSDIMMPKKSGFDVCRALKANPKLAHIPIVLLSAVHDHQYKQNSINEGAIDYINKPFDLSELHACIQTFALKKPAPSNTKKQKEAVPNTPQFDFKNPWPDLFETPVEKNHTILVKGDTGSGKTNFMMPFLTPYLKQAHTCSIWMCYNTPPDVLMRSFYAYFGPFLEQSCKENRFFLINATPSRKFDKHSYVYSLHNRYDCHEILNLVYDLKQKSQSYDGQNIFCMDSINAFINQSQKPLQLLDFFQILSQNADFFEDDLLFLSQQNQNTDQEISLRHLVDSEINLKYDNQRFLAQQSFSKMPIEKQWHTWEKA